PYENVSIDPDMLPTAPGGPKLEMPSAADAAGAAKKEAGNAAVKLTQATAEVLPTPMATHPAGATNAAEGKTAAASSATTAKTSQAAASDAKPAAEPTVKAVGYPVPGTTLFLVGNHFSVNNSKVIAGGRHVPYRLLSRQIMEVMIPSNVNTLTYKRPE